jgi:CarD family transcriptional regulator
MIHSLIVGQRVVHPHYGAGIVIEQCTDSEPEKHDGYYVIEIPSSALKVHLNLETAQHVHLRRVSSRRSMGQALGTLGGVPVELPRDYRERRAAIQDSLSKGEVSALARVIRDLHALQRRKSLSSAEVDLLASAKRRLAGELALVSKLELSQALQRVEATLSKGGAA